MMDLDLLYQEGLLSDMDHAFGRMIGRLCKGDSPWVALAAALVSRSAAGGDVCLDMQQLCDTGIPTGDGAAGLDPDIGWDQWRKALTGSPAVGKGRDPKPMILEGRRLYLQRYWLYENQVAQALLARCEPSGEQDALADKAPFELPTMGSGQDADQVRSVQTALRHRLAVISGGPGTGKTTTIAQIILTLRNTAGEKPPRIVLAAPTGKAASRMQEALDSGFERLLEDGGAETTEQRLEARTLHRLLGAVPGRAGCRYNRDNPLPADVVIVDEASMIDLSLMAKLVEALLPRARLILVGDKDQLASVEAGAVMGDICAGISAGSSAAAGPMAPHIVVLRKSYRFGAHSGIEALSRAVNAGDGPTALDLLNKGDHADIVFKTLPGQAELPKALGPLVDGHITPVFDTRDPRRMLEHINRVKILSPLRVGPYGTVALNHMVERILKQRGRIDVMPGPDAQWYAGRPVMIQRNDYYHHLFNGDVGVIAPAGAGADARFRAVFTAEGGALRSLPPEQLPAHETVYAMTVHKSQGTEFDKVLLVLPPKDAPVLTRELIYTAITRARRSVEIWGRPDIFMKAVRRCVRRASGLRDALWPSR